MPFNNSGDATFYGPYNDVAGSQFNIGQITQVFTSTSTALISRTTTNLPSTINSPGTMTAMGLQADRQFIMPESQTFREFIFVIFDLQATIDSIINVLGDTEDLRVLSQELLRTLTTTALTGRIIEAIGSFKGLVWCRRLTDKVGRSIYTLRKVVEAVKQYCFGVQRRVKGSAKEQLCGVVAHLLSGERDIDGIAREAFRKLIDCTNPLERFLCCTGQGLLHQLEYSFNKAIWQDLSAEIQSHLSIPRFRSPHGMITASGHIYPFDSYTTYSDLCMLLGGSFRLHGWVDTATEKLLSPKHLSGLIRQRSAPHITVEEVYSCQVLGDSSRDNYCPRCGSKSSYGEWRVCISCGLRFQTTAPKLLGDHQLYSHRLNYDGARYVIAMRFDWSILSSVTILTAPVPDPATALRLFQLLSNVNSPIRVLFLYSSRQPSIHIPDESDTGSSLPILQHLTKLTLTLFNEIFDLPTVCLPQITDMQLYLYSTRDSPVINWLLNFRTLTQLTLALQWHHPLGSIQQLLLGLPALEDLLAAYLSCITTSTLAQITETVRSIRAQDHPIRYIKVVDFGNQAEPELPDPWARTYSFLMLHTSQL